MLAFLATASLHELHYSRALSALDSLCSLNMTMLPNNSMDFLKFVVVGDGAVGKTAMLHSYCNNTFPDGYEPTIFDNYSVVVTLNGLPMTLALWDTAGQEDYDRLRPLSYPQTDVFLICYSLINPESLENAHKKWLPEVRLHCPTAKILLVGTKADLRDNAAYVAELESKGRSVVIEADAAALASRLGTQTVRCSALTQRGLKNVFDSGIRLARAPPPPAAASKASLLGRLLHRFGRGCRAETKRARQYKSALPMGM